MYKHASNIQEETKKYLLPASASTMGGNVLVQNVNANTTTIITQAINKENGLSPIIKKHLPNVHPSNEPVWLQKTNDALMGHASSHAVHIGKTSMTLHISRSLFWQFTTPLIFFLCAWLTRGDEPLYTFNLRGRKCNLKLSHLFLGLGIALLGINIALLFCNPFGLLLATTILGMVSAFIQIARCLVALINVWKSWKSGDISGKKALALGVFYVASIVMNCLTLGMLGTVLHNLHLITTIASSSANTLSQKITLFKEAAKLSLEQMPKWEQVTSFFVFCSNLVSLFCLAIANLFFSKNNNKQDNPSASDSSISNNVNSFSFQNIVDDTQNMQHSSKNTNTIENFSDKAPVYK